MLPSGRLPVTDNDLLVDELLFPARGGPLGGFTGTIIVSIDGLHDPLFCVLPLPVGVSFLDTFPYSRNGITISYDLSVLPDRGW